MSAEHTLRSERLGFLDALRGLAALWVVLFHMVFLAQPNLTTPAWASAWVSVGGIGVTLFFIVSAFSLCYTMPTHLGGPTPLLSFYARRFFRIAPLFYALLLFTICQNGLIFTINYDVTAVFANILFFFNIIPGKQAGIVLASWTIGVEMIFYAFFPLFYILFNGIVKTSQAVIWAMFLTVLFSFFVRYFPIDHGTYVRFSVIRHLPSFASGMLSFYFLIYLRKQNLETKPLGFTFLGLALLIFALVSEKLSIFAFLEDYWWQAVVFCPLLLGLALYPNRMFVNNITVFLGKLSFSLYLCHPPLIIALNPLYQKIYTWPTLLSVKYLAVVSVTLLLLIGISTVTYNLIEKPGIQLGKRFLGLVYHSLTCEKRA